MRWFFFFVRYPSGSWGTTSEIVEGSFFVFLNGFPSKFKMKNAKRRERKK